MENPEFFCNVRKLVLCRKCQEEYLGNLPGISVKDRRKIFQKGKKTII